MSDFDDRRKLFTQSIISTEMGTNAQKLYYVFTQELNNLKANYELLDDLLDITYCTGNLLDGLAAIVGTSRLIGESDSELRDKILVTYKAKTSNGAAKNICSIVLALDQVNTYIVKQNPEADVKLWDGQTTLDGLEGMQLINPATVEIIRTLDDTESVNYSIADFVYRAKAAGVNAYLFLKINLTNPVHYYEPPLTWDGTVILNGTTIMNEGLVQNSERWDGQTTLDGTQRLMPFIRKYNITHYRILDENDFVIKEEIHRDRFIDGIYVYSALLRENEANGKYIKKIQFLTDSIINFEETLPTAILKKQSLRILFFKENL